MSGWGEVLGVEVGGIVSFGFLRRSSESEYSRERLYPYRSMVLVIVLRPSSEY